MSPAPTIYESDMLRLDVVEWICRITAAMAGAEYGYFVRILLHPFECYMPRACDAGFGRTGTYL
jgi:hypothetical protein